MNVHAFAITAELPTAQEIFVSMDLTMIRRLYPAAALPDIRSALTDVADAGMGTFANDVFSVTPEAIGPLIVLDELLSEGARVSIDDFPLSALGPDEFVRQRVLTGLSGAVLLGEGQGRDRLRSFAKLRPAARASTSEWASALADARIYAAALPDD